MASISSPFPDLTFPMDLLDKDAIPSLDYHQLFFNYLRLLGFDSTSMSQKHRMKFDKDMFKFPNPKAFQHVTYFLFRKLNAQKAAENFRDVWPIVDKKQEAQYRKRVQQWLTQIQETNKDFLYAHVNLSIFLSPGGDKFVQLLCALASHIMEQRPKKKPSVVPPGGTVKTVLANQFRFQMIRGNLLLAIQDWAKLTSDFQSHYQQQKQLAHDMVVKYRELCRKKDRARAGLRDVLDHSGLSDEQKKAFLDGDADIACRDLLANIERKQSELNQMMAEVLQYEEPLTRSGRIIDSIVSLKKSRHCIDGKQILDHLPTEFIERYQNEHSGTRLELQFKEGRLDFLPLMNLLLFSAKTAAQWVSQLNFPPLQKQLVELNRCEQLVRSADVDIDRLSQRWSRVVEDQTSTIKHCLESQVQSVPMSLQSVTPFRNLLAKKSPIGDDEMKTPTALRTALGMTPAELGAAKVKYRPRISLEPTVARDVNRFVNRPDRIKALDPSMDAAEPLRAPQGVGRTPKNHFNTRLSLGNGPSPMLERGVHKPIESSPALSKRGSKLFRKSETGNKKITNGNHTVSDVPASVLERAAEAIVYDLVSLESPIASQSPCFFDPNSSFEKTAFQSKNLIGRSPEPESKSSNVDLLKILETSFVSPRRSSLTTSSARAPSLAGMNCSLTSLSLGDNLVDYDKEKGLLDASSASLIDDLLDFSLM